MLSSVSRLLLLCLLLVAGCAGRQPPPVAMDAPTLSRPEIPGEVMQVLEAGAASLDISIRMRSIEVLVAHTPEAGGGAWGPRAIYDPSPYVQRAGVDALGSRLAEAESRELLSRLVVRQGVEPYTRGRAALLLVHAGDSGVGAILQPELWDGEPSWVVAPLALASATMGNQQALEALAEAIEEGIFPLEAEFFLAIGRSGLQALVPSLEEAAELVEDDLQLPVGVALLGLGSSSGELIFREIMAADIEERKLEALDYLLELEGPVARRLVGRARSSSSGMVDEYGALVLVAWGEAPLKQALEMGAREEQESQVLGLRAAGMALARPGAEAPRKARRALGDLLNAVLEGDDDQVKLEALRALGRMGDRGELDLLRSHLQFEGEDGPHMVQVEAAAAMLAIMGR